MQTTAPSASPSTPAWWQRLQHINRDRLFGFLVLLPSIVLLGIFVYFFIGQTLYWSLTDWGANPDLAMAKDVPKNYIGPDNYKELFTDGGTIPLRFRMGLVNTFFFTLFFLVGCLGLGFLLAVLLDMNVRGEGIFRTIFLFPMALSFAVSGTAWRWLYDPEGGINVLPTVFRLDSTTKLGLAGGIIVVLLVFAFISFSYQKSERKIPILDMIHKRYRYVVFLGVPLVLVWLYLLPTDKLDNLWLNDRQPYRFNWHEVPVSTTVLIVVALLLVLVALVRSKRYLGAVYFGIPLTIFIAWIASDWLTWNPAWDGLAPPRNPGMHGTFLWNDVPQYVAAAVVIGFVLLVANLLWRAKHRAALFMSIPAILLVIWYANGGPDRLWMVENPYWQMGFNSALVGVIVAAVWQLSGYTMAMYLAGIRGVPEDLREAARVDGCNEFQVYTRIVLPLLRPITLSAAIVLGHISLKIFDLIYAMTGPDLFPVTVPGVQVYTMFRSNNFAKGGAIAIVLLILVALVIVPYLITALRSEHEV